VTDVFMRHQEWLDRRKFDDKCAGSLLIVGREQWPNTNDRQNSVAMWRVECNSCGYNAYVPAREVSPKARVALRSQNAGFPKMFVNREFETTTANENAKRIIREWIATYGQSPLPAPAIWGLNGRGKSHLLVATCEQLLKRYDITVRFWSIAGLLDDLQDAFGDNERHHAVWESATTVDLLALDDVGAEQVTDWRADRLARLVDERYQNERPILLATNYPPSAWEQTLGARTVSRLLGMTFQVELQGDDRRVAV